MNSKIRFILIVFIISIVSSVIVSSPAAAQSGIDDSNLNIGDINGPSEATTAEEATIKSSAEIPSLPADWSAELNFTLYVDGSQVATQEVSLTDGESVDVAIQHQFQESGVKEIYLEIDGELTREGLFSDQSTSIDRTSKTISLDITQDVGTNISVEGAAFVAPGSIQSDINDVRENIPDAVTENAVSHAFVVTSSDGTYIVFTGSEPQEGYVSVEGYSPDLPSISENGLQFEIIIANDITHQSPRQISVQEAYDNSAQYAREYIEIDAFHRSISINETTTNQSATAGVLVENPLTPDELFSSVGGQSRKLADGVDRSNIGSTLDDNVKTTLGDFSQPRVVTFSLGAEYWDNTETATTGILAAPGTNTRQFINSLDGNSVLPADSTAPVVYVVDNDYQAESISNISDIANNPSRYAGETVSFESNLYMETASSAKIISNSTDESIPIDVILHGGVAWNQAPDSRGDLISVMGASSIGQETKFDTRSGSYRIIGEVVSTDRVDGDFPEDYILIAYELKRQGSIDRTQIAEIIEDQSTSISDTLQQQANPDITIGPTIRAKGAAFTLPESLQNEVDQKRSQLGQAIGPHSFVLTNSDGMYIVFTGNEPQEGYVSVEGYSPDVSSISENGLQFGIIVANDITHQSPTQISVQEAYDNPAQYAREYIEVDAFHRSISINEVSTGQSASAGVLVENPLNPDGLFSSVGGQSRRLADGVDRSNIGSTLDDNVKTALGNFSQPRVVTFSLGAEYWDNTETATTGILAAPGTNTRQFINSLDGSSVLPADSAAPVVYVVDNNYQTESISNISDIANNPSRYAGETVSFESNLYMGSASSAKIIERSTGTPIPVDVILHGGVAWNQAPDSRDDLISIMGASSVGQNILFDTRSGSYRIIGEVVSTDRIDGNLPEGYVLIAYELNRQGSIDRAQITDLIEDRSSNISDTLERQTNPDADVSAGVQVVNPSLTPSTVDSSTSTHTLSFEVQRVSADAVTDNVTVTIPDTVELEEVSTANVVNRDIDIEASSTENTINVEANPDQKAETVDLEIELKLKLSA